MSESKDEWAVEISFKPDSKDDMDMSDSCPLDEAKGIDQAGSRKMFDKMVSRFKKYMPDMLQKVVAAHGDKNLQALHAEVHSLKGSSGYASATALRGCAVALHEASADDAPFADAQAQWQACDRALDALVSDSICRTS